MQVGWDPGGAGAICLWPGVQLFPPTFNLASASTPTLTAQTSGLRLIPLSWSFAVHDAAVITLHDAVVTNAGRSLLPHSHHRWPALPIYVSATLADGLVSDIKPTASDCPH